MNRVNAGLAVLGFFATVVWGQAAQPTAEEQANPAEVRAPARQDPFDRTGLDRPPPVVPDAEIQALFLRVLEPISEKYAGAEDLKDLTLFAVNIDSDVIRQLRDYEDKYELARQMMYFLTQAGQHMKIDDDQTLFVVMPMIVRPVFEQLCYFARIHPNNMIQAAASLVYSDQPGMHYQAELIMHEHIQKSGFGEYNFDELMTATARSPLTDAFALRLFVLNPFGAFEFFNDYENRRALQKPEEFQHNRRTLVSLVHARRWSAVTRDPAVRPWTISPTPETSELFAELLASPIWWHRAFAGALCKDHIWGEFVTPEIYDSLLEDPDRRVQAIMKFRY